MPIQSFPVTCHWKWKRIYNTSVSDMEKGITYDTKNTSIWGKLPKRESGKNRGGGGVLFSFLVQVPSFIKSLLGLDSNCFIPFHLCFESRVFFGKLIIGIPRIRGLLDRRYVSILPSFTSIRPLPGVIQTKATRGGDEVNRREGTDIVSNTSEKYTRYTVVS